MLEHDQNAEANTNSTFSSQSLEKKASPAGNRTPVFRVTGGDTHHYTTEDTSIFWIKVHFLTLCYCLRPYHAEYTGSRLITEVKQRRAWLVLGWVTAWESQVL